MYIKIMKLSIRHLVTCIITFSLIRITLTQDADYETYADDYLPETSFTCNDKVHGAYYADVETDCQMYHVCHKDKDGIMRSTKFLCGNGTVFDQRHLVCQDHRKVQRCMDSTKHYGISSPFQQRLDARLRSEKQDKEVLEAEHYRDEFDYPTYSDDNLPETSFTCNDKVHGAYYADIETECQMYHVCHKDEDGIMRSTKFLCHNGTLFDQRHLVCKDHRKVQRCTDSTKHYRNSSPFQQRLDIRLRSEKRDREIAEAEKQRDDYDYPTYSEDNLPETRFTCRDKVNGGYYADMETDCQMYHVCKRGKDGIMRSTKFLCGNGTVFDQQHLVCQDFRKVQRCQDSAKHYRNAATILELLEARLRTEKRDKEITDSARFESKRLK